MSAIFKYEQGWILRDTAFSHESESMKASAFALCNGYMGNRGTLEEMPASLGEDVVGTFIKSRAKFLVGTYINGIYDAPGGELSKREYVNVPYWASVNVWVDGEPLDLTTGEIVHFNRWMDLRDAVLHREMTWKSPKGKAVTLKTERFVSFRDIHCGFIRWRLEAEEGCHVRVESGIDGHVTNMRTRWHFSGSTCDRADGTLYLEPTTLEKEYHIGVACRNALAAPKGVAVAQQVVTDDDNLTIADRYEADLGAGEGFDLRKFTCIYTNRDVDVDRVRSQCLEELARMSDSGYEAARARHSEAWAETWKDVDTVIEGDDDIQIAVRFAAYHLVNTGPRHSSDISFPARTLSSQEHWGSVHWDTEIFIMPFFTYVLPEISRNMLLYRFKTLDGARRKAERLGYRGAFYAWESHETGDEICPSYVMPDRNGRVQRNFFWDQQIHISPDIAFAVWQYYEATGDLGFLLDHGAEIILEIARFNESRVHYDVPGDRYTIINVIGANEYYENVTDNAYTNWMVKETLAIAFKTLDLVKRADPERYEALLAKLDLGEEELAWWKDVADKLFVPLPDEETLLIEEHEGYLDKEDCTIEELHSRMVDEHEYIGGVGGLIANTQIIKQADVVLLLHLLSDQFSEEVKQANWDYYEARTEHGSSLSAIGYALVAAETGMVDKAYRLFQHAALMDLDPEYFAGYFSHGIHPCAIVGAWRTVVMGFSGVTLREDGVHWREPHLPPQWRKVSLVLRWHGHRIRFTYENGVYAATLEPEEAGVKVPFLVDGRREVLSAGQAVTIRPQGDAR